MVLVLICDRDNVDSTPMFQLLLSSASGCEWDGGAQEAGRGDC